jgi:integrase
MRVSLTDRTCAAAKSSAAQTDHFDTVVSGLALRVTKHGTKTWTLHYSVADRRKRMTLGRYPALSLAGARARALEAKGAIAEGRTPSGAGTLRAICAEYLQRAQGLRSVGRRKATLERLVYPTLGDRPIADIRRSEIIKLLDWVEDENGPVAADQTLAFVRKVMNWHASRSDDFRSPIVPGMARTKPSERARDRTLTDEEIRLLWPAAPPFVRFLLLTAVRRNEAAGMRHDEIVGNLWIIPAARMKGKAEHIVPLSAAALECMQDAALMAEWQDVSASCGTPFSMAKVHGQALSHAKRQGPFVFGGSRPVTGLSQIKRRLDEAVPIAPWRLHDLRRTARSLMSRAGVNKDIAERCLAHAIGGVRGTYDRHAYLEEKRQAFEALAGLVQRIVDPQPNVVAIKGGER